MRFLTLLVAAPIGVALASTNCNTKTFKALQSVKGNTKVCEYLHDTREQWSETGSKEFLPDGLKKFQPQDVYEACDCLTGEEVPIEAPVEAPVQAPKRGKYVEQAPEPEPKYTQPEPEYAEPEPNYVQPVKYETTKILKVPTTVTAEVTAVETITETELQTVERTVYLPRITTSTETSTFTVVSCTATETEALDTTTTTIAMTTETFDVTKTVTETETDYKVVTETETYKPETVQPVCTPAPIQEAEPTKTPKRERIDEDEYDEEEEYEEREPRQPKKPLSFMEEQRAALEHKWNRWKHTEPLPRLPESPYELENPHCAPKGSKCLVKRHFCCGGDCLPVFGGRGAVGVCQIKQLQLQEDIQDAHYPRQPNQMFQGSKNFGY